MATVVRKRDLRASATGCERAFGFLTTDFGYRHVSTTIRDAGFRIDYAGPVLGVRLDWEHGDPFFVWLVRLVDGDFPPRSGIRPDTPLDYLDLESLEDVVGYERQVETGDFSPLPDETTARLVAESLRSCGASLLRGDLGRWGAVETYIKQRFRDNLVKHRAYDLGRQLGWF
ncbi:hypothetical protein [Dactylosporangium sp. CA-092794]|uniref:hypothetical protein n=1 Tax=Dactylosporangium sp. CA-092794 TaxID=3239929 RepID=UPI003D8F447D